MKTKSIFGSIIVFVFCLILSACNAQPTITTPTSTPTNTPILVPPYTPTYTPTPTVTATLPPPVPPSSYVLFDDFNSMGSISSIWTLDNGSKHQGVFEQANGMLNLTCSRSDENTDGYCRFYPHDPKQKKARGIAIAFTVISPARNENDWGKITIPQITFTQKNGERRIFVFVTRGNAGFIDELYPQNNYKEIGLTTRIDFSPLVEHLIVVTYDTNDGLVFYLDGNKLDYDKQLPDLDQGAAWDNWMVEARVSKSTDNKLQATFDWVAVLP